MSGVVARISEPDPRRIDEVLDSCWQSLRGGREFPDHDEIDFSRLGEIWDACFLVRRHAGATPCYSYLYLGTALVEAYGGDPGAREICERLAFPSSVPLQDKFDEVVRLRGPFREESVFVNARGTMMRYRSVMLPLGDGQGEVAYILGGMRWKRYA